MGKIFRVLVIEDEQDLLKGLEVSLTLEGFQVIKAARGDDGLKIALAEKPDLVILDVMLPGLNGLEVCRQLRQRALAAPIIMLSAKGEEIDRVVGIEIGADDYLTKPFSLRELLARIRARLRDRPTDTIEELTHYSFGDIELNFSELFARRRGQNLHLTPREYEILRLLVRCRGAVVSRDRLLNQVWGYQNYPTTRTVDNHIAKLRQKLEPDPSTPSYILSVYGQGYKFVG